MYFGLLFRHRKGIKPKSAGAELAETAQLNVRETNEEIKYIQFLFDSYEPRCLYFEVVECVRKLMLTGMMIFFFPDTPSQASVRACVDCGLI